MAENENKSTNECNDCNKENKGVRICSVGGEALMEGIMMRAPNGYAQVVRKPDGTLDIKTKRQMPFTSANPFFALPLVRGTVTLVDSLVTGTKALFNSAEISATDDDPSYAPTKFDLWIEKHLGDKAMNFFMGVSLVISLVLSVTLFFILPNLAAEGVNKLVILLGGSGLHNVIYSLIEAVVRVGIFLGYMALVSNMKDIRRVFMYHGAEHKTIHCFEHYDELTVENVRKYSKHHPRCGTAFLFVVIVISIIVHAVLPRFDVGIFNILLRIATLPVIAGIAYEFNRYAGRHEGKVIKVLRAPGLAIQRFTTREPDDGMIEVAIVALQKALELSETPDYSAAAKTDDASLVSAEPKNDSPVDKETPEEAVLEEQNEN